MIKTGVSKSFKRAELLSLLKKAVSESGYLTREVLTEIALAAGVTLSEAYSVATFYSFLPVRPVGCNIIRICQCLPCELNDGRLIIERIQGQLGIRPGETTQDGKFSFELVSCIGACAQAPAMMINDRLYGNLTPAAVADILSSYK